MFSVSRVYLRSFRPHCRSFFVPTNYGCTHFHSTFCEQNVPKILQPIQRIVQYTLFNQIKEFSGCCPTTLPQAVYEYVCAETLESLNEYFEELAESAAELKDADISYGDGVLTVRLGGSLGTYVINRQSPNKQIWLSSPFSGPKRYDFVILEEGKSNGTDTTGYWIYKQDQNTLHELLQKEVSGLIKNSVNFLDLSFGSR